MVEGLSVIHTAHPAPHDARRGRGGQPPCVYGGRQFVEPVVVDRDVKREMGG
jgi:hypothetical protein